MHWFLLIVTDSGVVVVDTSKASPSYGKDQQATISKIETLRKEFGDSWLTSLGARTTTKVERTLYKPDSAVAATSSAAEGTTKGNHGDTQGRYRIGAVHKYFLASRRVWY